MKVLVGLLEELEQAGVAFRSATEPIDTSTPTGRMLVQLLGVFAEFERATIIDQAGAATVASELNADACRTRSGRRWSPQAVLFILRNRSHLGEVTFRDVCRRPACPS